MQDGQQHVQVEDWPKLSGLQVSMLSSGVMTAIFLFLVKFPAIQMADGKIDPRLFMFDFYYKSLCWTHKL